VTSEEEAVAEAAATGYPVLLKATGGGGGIGIYTCPDEAAVRANFEAAGRCARIPALAPGNTVDPVP
jgi:urea carboxylase